MRGKYFILGNSDLSVPRWRSLLKPFPGTGPTMRATGLTTGTSLAGRELIHSSLNPLAARLCLFGRVHPTNPFVAHQWCQLLSGSQLRPF